MPNKDLTLMVCVLDRSGSMHKIVNDAVGGFNSLIEEQKKCQVGKIAVTVAMFNREYELLYNNEDISKIQPFTATSYCPSGSTALLDAVGKTINEVGKKLNDTPEDEKPGKVVFVILTDGEENSSEEFNLEDVKKLIEQQRTQWKWEFIFLASDEKSFEAGSQMGYQNVSRYGVNNTKGAYAAVSRAVINCRSNQNIEIDKDIS